MNHLSAKSSDVGLTLQQRQDELANIVNTTSTAFMGLTAACARCYDHKFDPILQRHYYQHMHRSPGYDIGVTTLQRQDL